MKEETKQQINDALQHLNDATKVHGLSVFALVMPRDTRGSMDVQMLTRGNDTRIAHKLYECMRNNDALPFDLLNIIMTAAAKWLGEQPDGAKQAFDRTVEKCRKQWLDTQDVQAILQDCREVIDKMNDNE